MGAPRLTLLAEEAERIVFCMPEEAREQARTGIVQIFLGARSLTVLPDELLSVLWKVVGHVVLKSTMPGAKKRTLVLQILEGAPRLLGPIKDEILGADLSELEE